MLVTLPQTADPAPQTSAAVPAEPYQLSGKWGGIVSPLLALPVAAAASVGYAYAIVYNPFVYLSVLVWVAYMAVLAILLMVALKVSNCRSNGQALLFGLGSGLIWLYMSWVAFSFVLVARAGEVSLPWSELWEIARKPQGLMTFASTLLGTGWFEVSDHAVKGGLLGAVWAIEGLGIVLAGVVGGHMALNEEIYCERCDHWVEEDDQKLELALSGDEAVDGPLTAQIKAGHLQHLWTLPKVTLPTDKPFLRVNLRACPDCHDCAGLDVDLVTFKKDAKGKVEEDSDDVSPLFSLPDARIQELRARIAEDASGVQVAEQDAVGATPA